MLSFLAYTYGVTVACLCWRGTVQKMAQVKMLDIFRASEFFLRNLIAHFCIVWTKGKKDSSASVALTVLVGRPGRQYTVKGGVKYPRFSLWAATTKLTWSESILIIEMRWWLNFLILRHLPYKIHHATNLIAITVASSQSFVTKLKSFMVSRSTTIWICSIMNRSLPR